MPTPEAQAHLLVPNVDGSTSNFAALSHCYFLQNHSTVHNRNSWTRLHLCCPGEITKLRYLNLTIFGIFYVVKSRKTYHTVSALFKIVKHMLLISWEWLENSDIKKKFLRLEFSMIEVIIPLK